MSLIFCVLTLCFSTAVFFFYILCWQINLIDLIWILQTWRTRKFMMIMMMMIMMKMMMMLMLILSLITWLSYYRPVSRRMASLSLVSLIVKPASKINNRSHCISHNGVNLTSSFCIHWAFASPLAGHRTSISISIISGCQFRISW